MMPKRTFNKRIRAVPWLVAIPLLAVVLFWRSRPLTFTLMGRYLLSPQFYTGQHTSFGPAGLFIDSITPRMDEAVSPHTYALLNWDGRPCWTVNTPSFNPIPTFRTGQTWTKIPPGRTG